MKLLPFHVINNENSSAIFYTFANFENAFSKSLKLKVNFIILIDYTINIIIIIVINDTKIYYLTFLRQADMFKC